MSDEINVISRTQQIFVEPSSSAISVINAGPEGPAGPAGAFYGNTIWKSTYTNRASDATLTDDPELATAVIEVNVKVRFRIFLWWTTPVAADFKYNITGPAGAYLAVVRMGGGPGSSPAFVSIPTSFPIAGSHVETSGTDFGAVLLEGVMQNAGSAGAIKVQWAQNTSNATPTALMQGSYIDWMVLPV